MWALGKIMRCPEVPKVYIGSFWPYWSDKNVLLRDAIKEDLDAVVKEIIDLPNSYHHKRVNDVVRRARNVGHLRIHSYVMDEIVRQKMFFKRTPEAVDTETEPQKLRDIYRTIVMKRRIVLNDLPDPETFHNKAKKTESKDWSRIDPRLEKLLNSFIDTDVSPIVKRTLEEKKIDVPFKVPRKDFNNLVKRKKLPEFLPPSSSEAGSQKEEKKSEKEGEQKSPKHAKKRSKKDSESGSKKEKGESSLRKDKEENDAEKEKDKERERDEGSPPKREKSSAKKDEGSPPKREKSSARKDEGSPPKREKSSAKKDERSTRKRDEDGENGADEKEKERSKSKHGSKRSTKRADEEKAKGEGKGGHRHSEREGGTKFSFQVVQMA
ncbi:unnamed protein product [Gongylonema pulchrum]|uniref:DUF5600 domain-containing protein n=1 Tax=Gongylonema pulchrum TaxID=637853 RepID=A0A183EGX5_9BILA|nr:unnamed protein product [Gongylonema pulchrum]